MRRAGALLGLIFCALAAPAAARGVHMVLKVDVPAAETGRRDEIMTGCRDIVRHRLEGLGIVSAKVAVERPDRIVADIPDTSDLAKLRQTFDPAKPSLSFRLVDEAITDEDLRAGRVPKGVEILQQRPARGNRPSPPLAVYRGEIVAGERITNAMQSLTPHTAEPDISLKFDSVGAMQFAKFTEENVGKRIAIVLNGKVVSAPVIREPIRGGIVLIAGDFTVEEASDLAASLRGGAVPAPLTIVELKQTP